MNNYVSEIINSVFHKNIADYFSVFNKEVAIQHLHSVQKDLSQCLESNIDHTSHEQFIQKTSKNELTTFSQTLRNQCSNFLALKKDLFNQLLNLIEKCKHEHLEKDEGNVLVDYEEESTYFGSLSDGKRSGLGYFAEPDKSYVFLGNWEENFHSQGILLVKKEKQNEIFIGNFELEQETSYNFNGLFIPLLNNPQEHKEQTLSFAYGNITDQHRNIEGVIVFASNSNTDMDIYLGKMTDFKKDDSNAFLLNFRNNESIIYSGKFVEDHKRNHGLLLRSNSLFEFNYSEDSKITKSLAVFIILPDKSVYNGEIIFEGDHTIHLGKCGTILFGNNHIYRGGLSKGKKSGQGSYFIRNASNEELFNHVGQFVEDHLVSGKILKKHQDKFILVFEGDFNENQPSHGKYYHEQEEVYEGNFSKNLRDGKGKYSYADHSHYEGDWKSGHKQGHGKFVDVNNNIFNALWEDNQLIKMESCVPGFEDKSIAFINEGKAMDAARHQPQAADHIEIKKEEVSDS